MTIKSESRLKPKPVVYQGICMNWGHYDGCEREVWSKYEKTKRCGACLREGVTVVWNSLLRNGLRRCV